jgi:hypothetical protein
VTIRGALRGWIVVVLAAVVLFASGGHDFLAITDPVQANVLVVEGWIWESAAMKEAAKEFDRGKYDVVVSVGVLPTGQQKSPWQENSAARAAEQLRKLGVADRAIHVLTVSNIDKHRTYTSALAVRRWLANSKIHVSGINVFTLGAHARKSLVLFKRAFGSTVPVGVIAGTEDSYDPERWWLSIRGIYTVLRKAIGYLYAEWWPLLDNLFVSSDQLVSFGGR